MQTTLAPEFLNHPDGREAEAILRKCVHCGFCTATCPTYQLLGDEQDGPRGRIYLIKQVLEGAPPTRSTQQHLDRCLTCRNCETTCPSGVEYGRLVDIGRRIVDDKVGRSLGQSLLRWLLRAGIPSRFFAPALSLARRVRPLLPQSLRAKVRMPVRSAREAGRVASRPVECVRQVLVHTGCVQDSLAPDIHPATVRVLGAIGIGTIVSEHAGCCGAIRDHLGDHEGGLRDARQNIDAWWPLVERGEVEAIISNASGCGLAIKDYGRAFAHDQAYAERARKVSRLTRDLSEYLPEIAQGLAGRVRVPDGMRLAYHPPCTLQHGQRLRGGVEAQLAKLGFDIRLATSESHLCCGSAGTYSILEAQLATRLRDRKLSSLADTGASGIISANVGCISHLQGGTSLPVRHWIEALDDTLI